MGARKAGVKRVNWLAQRFYCMHVRERSTCISVKQEIQVRARKCTHIMSDPPPFYHSDMPDEAIKFKNVVTTIKVHNK